MQQINFTGNLSGNNNRLIFLITEEAKDKILDFSQILFEHYNFSHFVSI